mmetsp:Transcript_28705/g.81117  ORF Transcript_28705/g.81117 Transcript_28705/m.81117 type:complete len:230 (+) Transcript_28705:640-1329(+)
MAEACSVYPPLPVRRDCVTMESKRSPPRQYSRTRVTLSASSKNSKRVTTCGCFSVMCVLISPSSPRRFRLSRWARRALRTIFAAFSTPSAPALGAHLQTRPKVPSPRGPSPTREYLSVNWKEFMAISSVGAANRLEQLSSRASMSFGASSHFACGPAPSQWSPSLKSRGKDRTEGTENFSDDTLTEWHIEPRFVGSKKSAPSSASVASLWDEECSADSGLKRTSLGSSL